MLKDVLCSHKIALSFLSEPQIFQADIDSTMRPVSDQYCYYLNSDDLHDPELAMIKSRSVGGTLVMWTKHLDPFVTIHPVSTTSFTPLILQLPGHPVSIHLALYLPTSGREQDFVSEITNLRICMEELIEMFPDAIIYIRGDSNVNQNNTSRVLLLNQFLELFSLLHALVDHNTYHHFVGNGLYDSNIDVLLYSGAVGAHEEVTSILCKHDHPAILSHHDIILSICSIPVTTSNESSSNLLTAPRVTNNREKILWTPEGAAEFEKLVTPQLRSLRETWLHPTSQASMSILLQMTNCVLSKSASITNKPVNLSTMPGTRPSLTPLNVSRAKQRMNLAHHKWIFAQTKPSSPNLVLSAKCAFTTAQKFYKKAVRSERLSDDVKRDKTLFTVLGENPSTLYSYIKTSRSKGGTHIEKLTVRDKVYVGDKVPDGFYDSMTCLKSCDMSKLLENPEIAEQFSNYEHIKKLCQDKEPLPTMSRVTARDILSRIKKNVKDFYSITALHYTNAGEEGLTHFHYLLNAVIEDVNNAKLKELNIAIGLILHKGHNKEKTSDRSYRTISSCPFLSKSLDLYIRDLYIEQWDACQAVTQYQGSGSTHELASLLVTEVIQHSLHVANKPVFFLALDALSAFDRCLRQILVCELFMAGMEGDAITVIDNRLSTRSTVYEWNKELLGPAPDITGFAQGGINSSYFYKLYNNEQLEAAQASELGVDLGSVVVSATGLADDVMLSTNNIDSMRLLVTLTEQYCHKYRVLLVPSKTKLIGYSTAKQKHLLDHAKLINPVTINGLPVKFVDEAEHVGVLRNTAGNMPNIINRITSHKKAMASVLSVGLARGHYGNPQASLKVHQLYGTPVLFSGLASLFLSKPEVSIIDGHYQRTVLYLQKLHDRTPRCVVFLLGGCLPGEAILHQKQLTLFLMICHLPTDPLYLHAKQVLLSAPVSAKSWFQQIRKICLQYGLEHPLTLLDSPPPKAIFKRLVKELVTTYWENVLRDEAANLPSLHYFVAENWSLRSPHPIWSTAGSNSYECRKTSVLAKMISGRFRTEYLTRHWSSNKQGFCLADTCVEVVGDLEHLLIHCPALSAVRVRLWNMFFSHSVKFPSFYNFLLCLEKSEPNVQLQFFLDPTAFPDIAELWELLGQPFINHLYYLTRTYAYYLYRQKQILLGIWSKKPDKCFKNKTRAPTNNKQTNNIFLVSGHQNTDYMREESQPTNMNNSFNPSHAQITHLPLKEQLLSDHAAGWLGGTDVGVAAGAEAGLGDCASWVGSAGVLDRVELAPNLVITSAQ